MPLAFIKTWYLEPLVSITRKQLFPTWHLLEHWPQATRHLLPAMIPSRLYLNIYYSVID